MAEVNLINDKMRLFLEVCECGSFTKAAQKLFITQSALSQQIMRLEKEMGTELVKHRRGGRRNLIVSKHGEVLFQRLKEVVKLEHLVKQELLMIENEMPPEHPLKKCNHLCLDEGYIDSRKVLTRYFEGTDGRYQRAKILKELKNNTKIRTKLFTSGARNFIYYHEKDLQRFIKSIQKEN